MTIYNLNVDIVYNNVYTCTKIGLNKSFRSQDIKKWFLMSIKAITLLQIWEKYLLSQA